MSTGISATFQGRIQGTFLNEFGIGMQDLQRDVENEKYINRTDSIMLTTTG